ncbi:YbgA family protein [Pseudoalteromonas sp. SS15]|uniref:YbgA family protein n=1 Tax=Pseudoalteromonas sp. SS15 TaxID=3139393 RepID=UPI003BA8CB48
MNEFNPEFSSPIKIGISACLTGDQVRFDKSHKKSDFCMNQLGKHVEYEKFCPEVAVGLPIPRPTIRQIKYDDVIAVSRPDGSMDVTEKMTEFGQKVASRIDHLSGFVFMKGSPSCGMERVKVYYEHGKGCEHNGVGLFAKQILDAHPNLPCEENGRLNDAVLRENFVMRVYTYKKWQELLASGLTKHKLIEFHSQNKYLVMSHNLEMYRKIGNMLGQSKAPLEELSEQYISMLMSALKKPASRRNHTNTLQHLQGYFKKVLDKTKKEELTEQVMAYRQGLVPLLVPLTLINHYLRDYPNEYLSKQAYLNPYPADLKLRYSL